MRRVPFPAHSDGEFAMLTSDARFAHARFGKPSRSSTRQSSSPRFIPWLRWRPKHSGLAVLSYSVRRPCSWPWQDSTRLVDGRPISDARSAPFASRWARARRILLNCWDETRLSRRSLASSSACHSR